MAGLASESREQVVIRELNDNPGIIPVKLGTAKVKDYTFTLIHYYDLNPIILEINKLHIKSANISGLLSINKEYLVEASNYLKILNLTKDRVETKIKEILPHPERTKRGIINGLGSIFKAITGNLDASDGERYEQLINDLQNSQRSLQVNTLKQRSLSLQVIKKFNSTISQISHNEKLIESKINQISSMIHKTAYRENSFFIKDVINQIINVYEIIDSILQDIENSLTFSRLKIMHPSIIRTEDLFFELTKLKTIVSIDQMPIPITLENTLKFEKLIQLESFILNNKITYLLHIPITHPQSFDYFHLYSVPIHGQSQFKVVLPKNKYVVKNQLHFAYYNHECQETLPESYICEKEELGEINEDSPCAVKLLSTDKDVTNCRQVKIKFTRPIATRMDNTDQWILAIPSKKAIVIKCLGQDETRNLIGTYLCRIPRGCQITVDSHIIINEKLLVKQNNQPILFPDFEKSESSELLPTLNLSLHLQEINLDELHKLEGGVSEQQPQTIFGSLNRSPSIWTLLVYIIIAAICVHFTYKKMVPKFKKKDQAHNEDVIIQLPHLAQ